MIKDSSRFMRAIPVKIPGHMKMLEFRSDCACYLARTGLVPPAVFERFSLIARTNAPI